MKKKLPLIILLVVFIGITVHSLKVGISLFTAEHISLDDFLDGDYSVGDVVDGIPEYGTCNSYDVVHRVNFIPLMKEHYYLVMNENSQKAVFVRAGKKFSENFDADDHSNIKNVSIEGALKKFDGSIETDLSVQLSDARSEIHLDCFIDTYSTRISIMSLILGIGNILLAISFALLIRPEGSVIGRSKIFVTSFAVSVIVCVFLFIYLIMMNF